MPSKKIKKKNLLSRINFRSRKIQLLTTVLVFAVIGGGILIYKSFAASATWSYSIANGASVVTGSTTCSNQTVYNDSTKNNTPVWAITQKNNCGGGQPWVQTGGPNAPYIGPTIVNNWYRFCAWVRGGTANVPFTIRFDAYPSVTNSAYSSVAYNALSTTAYNYYCSGWLYINSPTAPRGEVIMTMNSTKRAWYVSTLVLEQNTTNPNAGSSPSPSPGK